MNTDSKPLDRLKHHITGAVERGEKEAIVSQPYISSIIQKYGDTERVKQDVQDVQDVQGCKIGCIGTFGD